MKKTIVAFFATGFFVGKIPKAPGTWGTVVAIPIVLLLHQAGPFFYMGAALALLIFAAVIAEWHERLSGTHDPGEIVIDEIVGFVITMMWLPMTWQAFVAGFALFRLLDIVKPFPIRQIDERVPGGLGTVLDDAAAGVIASILLQIVYTYTPWLGVVLDGTQLG